MTLKEHFGELKGKTLSWIGDGNNVLHDLMIGALKLGMNVRIAHPVGYEPDRVVFEEAVALATAGGLELFTTSDPKEAVTGTNVVVTDTWVSMGQEQDASKRKSDFAGYQVTMDMIKLASNDAVFLHCLPRKPEEVTDEVISPYSNSSIFTLS